MADFPKDGSTFVVESIDRTACRWAKYKPDGARQMKKPGRWQKQVWSGDYFKWENCEEPVGQIAPDTGDGPISGAVNALAAKDAEIERMQLRLTALEHSARVGADVDHERDFLAMEARRYASHYPEASDGRNTFVMFAEMIESRAGRKEATDA